MKKEYRKARVFSKTGLFYDIYKLKNRTIYNPCEELRKKQKLILNLINMVYIINLNTRKAAEVHCNRKWILKTDIKSFYDSFSKEQIERAVNELCEKLKSECQTDMSAKYIYDYCTYNDKLPTGALTSAHLANLAFMVMKIDDIIIEFCLQNKINYSRYIDDLTFSADNKSKLQEAEKFVQKLLSLNGFTLNSEKTKYISDNKRQEVLGILVNNSKITISKINKKNLRSTFFNYLKSVKIEQNLGTEILFERKLTFEKILGYMAYLKNTDLQYYEKMKEYLSSKINKFNLNTNAEIEKLAKILQLKNLQLKIF